MRMQRCLQFHLNLLAGCCVAMVLLLTAAVPVTHAQPPAQIRVGYIVTAARISAEDQAAIDWLTANRRFSVSVSYASRPSWKLPVCDVLWLHCPDAGEYRAMQARPAFMQALRTALARSGKIVATDYAAFLPADLGIEPVRPVVRYDTLQNDWLWDKKGYNSFRGHPLFNGLFGGDYVWDATVDQILPIVGYFGDVWPARGRVVAVEKSYVFLHGERKIAIEHNAGTGRILSLGGMIYFSKENHLRGNLEQFMENALLLRSRRPSRGTRDLLGAGRRSTGAGAVRIPTPGPRTPPHSRFPPYGRPPPQTGFRRDGDVRPGRATGADHGERARRDR